MTKQFADQYETAAEALARLGYSRQGDRMTSPSGDVLERHQWPDAVLKIHQDDCREKLERRGYTRATVQGQEVLVRPSDRAWVFRHMWQDEAARASP